MRSVGQPCRGNNLSRNTLIRGGRIVKQFVLGALKVYQKVDENWTLECRASHCLKPEPHRKSRASDLIRFVKPFSNDSGPSSATILLIIHSQTFEAQPASEAQILSPGRGTGTGCTKVDPVFLSSCMPALLDCLRMLAIRWCTGKSVPSTTSYHPLSPRPTRL